jgi:hypothetical protein
VSPYSPLVIRRTQLRALGLSTMDSFLDRLAVHVARVFPGHAQFVHGRRGRLFLQRCVARARAYGLADEHSIALFTDLAVALGESFDDAPPHAWMRALLADSGLGASAKMFLVYKDLPERCPGAPLPPPRGSDEDDESSGIGIEAAVPRSREPLWWGEAAP